VRLRELEARVIELAAPLVEREGFELVGVEYRPGKRAVLRIFIDFADIERSVGLEDCALVSRIVSDILDTEDLIPGSYRLEVSSPGVERPLRTIEDFIRFRGRDAKVVLNRPVEGRSSIAGEIADAGEGKLVLRIPSGEEVEVDIHSVTRANLTLQWPSRKKK